jgi:hypothetical protein
MSDYTTWEDLLDEEPPQGAPPAAAAESAPRPADAQAAAAPSLDPEPAEPSRGESASGPALAGDEVPEELRALWKEREALEDQMRELTGQKRPDPDAGRRALLFPVPVHTKETRIAERRMRSDDEQRLLEHQRARERVLLERRAVVRGQAEREEQRLALRLRMQQLTRWIEQRTLAAQAQRRREQELRREAEEREHQQRRALEARVGAQLREERTEQERCDEQRRAKERALALVRSIELLRDSREDQWQRAREHASLRRHADDELLEHHERMRQRARVRRAETEAEQLGAPQRRDELWAEEAAALDGERGLPERLAEPVRAERARARDSLRDSQRGQERPARDRPPPAALRRTEEPRALSGKREAMRIDAAREARAALGKEARIAARRAEREDLAGGRRRATEDHDQRPQRRERGD